MKRLTTNCPDNNLDAALNLFYIKDFETWVRGGGDGPDYPDIRLYDFIRKAAKILLPDLDFPMDDDDVDYAMGELLLDGPDEPTGLLALLYTAAWSYAELRGRLMQYEDTGLTPEEAKRMANILMDVGIDYNCSWEYVKNWLLDARLRELAEADKNGRLVVLPCKAGDTVWAASGKIIKCEIEEMYLCDGGGIEYLVTFDCDGADCKGCPFNRWEQDCSGERYCECEYGCSSFKDSDIGKTVFLTREEAKAALEAMKDA